ncbi:MAG TPA: hypothetical protein VFN55_07410 [Solirubrobacteraceae bacterium]|nr:hypothetical protein [Solirubrobacteraceae bacterium]
MIRRPLILLLTIAALCMSLAATASAATTAHAGSINVQHLIKTPGIESNHSRVQRAGVTRAGVHHRAVAVTALGVHHIGDPIAYAATAR